MNHYAKVKDGCVIEVIVAGAEFFDTFIDTSPGTWLATDANTMCNQHALGGTPLRGNYAALGYVYDYEHDVFYPPRPFASWTIDPATWSWQPPIPKPESDGSVIYDWDEANQNWFISLSIPR
jgi:hypothetical protein